MPKGQDGKQAVWGKKKNAIMRAYRKMLKDKKPKNMSHNRENKQDEQQTFFQRAMSEYERRKAFREEKKKAIEAKRKEREEARKKYEQKKRLNMKKLSQRTKWGQPVMKGRMEILLEKIERTVGSDSINR
ncbi:thyroid transcription factor 1-associated protein 26 isoform X1 [Parasteatoda tepidariorum]|uniref:thyroid transcription factor 1-associated protein 26 isoform X1 n=1 Tax=Parasteatoda tepidariorum TaxID=114398 RepID=UPI00077FB70D|nr:thyroid transcription factor 1-associated protein 26 isoform X2 [Parasteatoda tepidariorum]